MSAKSPSNPSSSRRREPSRARRRSKPAEAGPLAPGLYLVATPIGNLADISLRALDVLARADLIACEDTRTSRKLLGAHGIQGALTAYHEHNAARVRPRLMERLKCGAAVALVSDAGTPLVSDPGYKLVEAAIAEGVAVTAIPGASAGLTALSVSGLPTDRFFFAGFLPAKAGARRRVLAELAPLGASLVFYESARRLPAALAQMAEVLGPRPAAVARELTKLHEEVRRGALPELAEHYRTAGPPKGEVVVVVGPPQEGPSPLAAEDLDARLRAALAGTSLRDAVAAVAAASGLPRKRVYARALELAGESDHDR
ncbi:MAG: 16S rRNA (cytidine(1402)-2'-O)-methyltransferase [Kiloniellales bacterium]